MGVPKFCRFICERYPSILEMLNEYQIPEFDNLYLDMNGIIHCCSHPNDTDVQFRITEEDIFKNIFQYIEMLFNKIKPQKLFFMAVDGVAPRAKINQQRGRRFRAAKEAEAMENRARARGENIPEEARFDSNCITPGTVFMSRLIAQLKYFVTWKISTNKLWQKCKIILSGPEIPGEGEHKIMDYIRYMRAQPDHDPNTRHCLYGLDADLIMLSLCTHEPHFTVLREEVKYGRQQKKKQSPDKIKFCLLHISLLRDYLEHEFSPVKDKISFPFDVEKLIDDWILMGFLVGNDFIPNLPNLLVEEGALPLLCETYMEVLPTLDGYINEAGTLKLDRFEKFMERLAQVDTDQFAEHFADLKYFEAKTGRRPNENERTSYRRSKDSPESVASPKKSANKELSALIQLTDDMLIGHSDEEEPLDVDSDTEMYQIEFLQHKRDYYMNKLEYENVDAEVMRSQAEAYVTAIQWNLHYYYNGCCSWSWYYPHHYAPYISDVKEFKDLDIKFEKAEPFLPFQQLLAVLPAASKQLLPHAYQDLLTEVASPIIDYYPADFKTDLNQKKHEWEAVVLIPFIDEKNLLDAMEPYNAKLTDEERKRNSFGPMYVMTYTDEFLGLYEAPEYFPTIRNHAKVEHLNREDIEVPREKLVKGLMKGVNLDVYFPGFPTLRYIEHSASFDKAKVKVFEHKSRYESMMLSILPKDMPDINQIASELLGKVVFTAWPHLREAMVVGLSMNNRKISLKKALQGSSPANLLLVGLDPERNSEWRLECSSVAEHYMVRFGIKIGETRLLVHALPMIGLQYSLTARGTMSLEKAWAKTPVTYAYQTLVRDIAVHEPGLVLDRNISEVYAVKGVVFMLGHPHYGAMGEVTGPHVVNKSRRIKVAMRIVTEPNFESVKKQFTDSEAQWMSTSIAAQRLGLSSHFLSRITGSIYVTQGSAEAPENVKQNVGLNLKFTKRNEELPGYTKKSANQWLYSNKSIGLIRSYMHQFPVLFERLARRVSNDIYTEHELFESSAEKLSDVVSWLKDQPFASIDTRSCNALGLDAETIEKIKKVEKNEESSQSDGGKTVLMQVRPHLLFKPGLNSGNLPPDPKAEHRLFDRVVSVKEDSSVPLGYKGTIVGIGRADDDSETVYDVLFDKEFVGGVSFTCAADNRKHKLHESEFINISHGMRAETDIAALTTTGSGQPRNPPQVPWRKETANSKKKGRADFDPFAWFGKRKIPVPPNVALSSNSKIYDVDQEKQQEQKQQQQPQMSQLVPQEQKQPQMPQQPQEQKQPQIRVMKKAEAPQNAELLKKSKQNPPKWRAPKQAPSPELPEPKKQPQSLGKPRADANSEFQMLWNELQKPPGAAFDKKPMKPPGIPQQKQTPVAQSGDPLQDESAFLKAMLKISDESSSTSSQSTISQSACKPIGSTLPTPNTSSAPPLVQQLFDHARQANRKENVSYCAMLLTHSQLIGGGMPRYNYLSNPHKMVSAQIVLPDMRTYCGEFCMNHAEAAESAAKVVCKELNLDSMLNPGIGILGAPPAMWLNPRQNDIQPQLHNAVPPPMMPPRSPQVFPNMQHPPMHLPHWNPRMPRVPAFSQPPLPNVNHNRATMNSSHPVPPQQAPQEAPRVENKVEQKSKKSTPFVPLQAQKKTRNSKSKQTPRSQNHAGKESNQPQTSQLKPREEAPKQATKDEKLAANERKEPETKKSPQTPQKVQQRAPKPRRSRIAANFNSTPPANGSGPQ